MDGICGFLNNEVNIQFAVQFDDELIDNFDPSPKFPLLKDSKSHEKGGCLPFNNIESKEYQVDFVDLINTISVKFSEVKTKPLVRIYCKLPNPDKLAVSELYVKGYIDFEKIIINKKSIDPDTLTKKLTENKKVTIADKLHIEIIGPPLMKEQLIQTEVGSISRVRRKLNVEI